MLLLFSYTVDLFSKEIVYYFPFLYDSTFYITCIPTYPEVILLNFLNAL